MAIILGKKKFGRLETLRYANDKFFWADNIVIGISAFYAFWAWVLARLTKRKVIYYCIDFYSPEIGFTLWDKIFIWSAMQMDKFLLKHCDKIWDISDRINEGRWFFGHYRDGSSKIVPLSYPPLYFYYKDSPEFKRGVFIGLEPYGFELLENIDFDWLGKGKIQLEELLSKLSGYAFGISLWRDNGNNYYGDPGKTKLYSACGLPVIMTDNSPYARIIKETGAGLVIPYDKIEVEKAVDNIMSNYWYFKNNVNKTWSYINADTVFNNRNLLE